YYLDPAFHTELTLSLAQAWFLYLPLRRVVRAGLHRFRLMRSLLYQVAALLHTELAPHLIDTEIEVDEQRSEIFATLVECWHRGRLATVHYRRPNASRPTEMVIAPYWFEPAVWTDAFYLLAGLRRRNGSFSPLTLKLDRIQRIEMHSESFERPDSEMLLTSIEKTWGTWLDDEHGAVPVRLRFHNRQLDRLRETCWHPTQRLTLAPDGTVIWDAEVAEPQEMLPWIRGWGPDVEVLEPADIREQVASEATATARLYGRNAG